MATPGAGVSGQFQVAVDVVIRWKDHGKYGSRQKAAAALQRRAAVPSHEAERLLDLVSTAHEEAVRAVPLHALPRRLKLQPFASAADIDRDACRANICRAVPDLPQAAVDAVLDWVIYWHWMR